jgi:hypothetical protein
MHRRRITAIGLVAAALAGCWAAAIGLVALPAGAQSPLGQAIMPNFSPTYEIVDGTPNTTLVPGGGGNNLNFLTVYPIEGGYQFQLGFQQPYVPASDVTAFVVVHPEEGDPYRLASELDGSARLDRGSGAAPDAPALGPWEADDTTTVTAELIDGRPSFTVDSASTGIGPSDDVQFGWMQLTDGNGWIQVSAPTNLGALAAQAPPDTIAFSRLATEFVGGLPLGWRVHEIGGGGGITLDRDGNRVTIELPADTSDLETFVTLGSAVDFEHLVLWNFVQGQPSDPAWTAYDGMQLPATEIAPVTVEIADGRITIPLDGLDALFPGEDGNGLTVRTQTLFPSPAANGFAPARATGLPALGGQGPTGATIDLGLQTPVIPLSVLASQQPLAAPPSEEPASGGGNPSAETPSQRGDQSAAPTAADGGDGGIPPWLWAGGASVALIGGGLAWNWLHGREETPVAVGSGTTTDTITSSGFFTPVKCSEEYIRRWRTSLGLLRGELDELVKQMDAVADEAKKLIDAVDARPDDAPIPTEESAAMMRLSLKWAGLRNRWAEKAKGLDDILAKLKECGVEPGQDEYPLIPAEEFGEAIDDAYVAGGPKVPVGGPINPYAGLMVTTTMSDDTAEPAPDVPGLEEALANPTAPATPISTGGEPDVPGLEDENATEDVMPATDKPANLTIDGEATAAGGLFGTQVDLSYEAIIENFVGEDGARPPGTEPTDVDPNADYESGPAPSFKPQGPPPDDGAVM